MVCIFGFDFHDQFCLLKFATTELSDLDTVICAKCENEFRSDYELFLDNEEMKTDWKGNFEDFLSHAIHEQLIEICKSFYSESFQCDLTGFDYSIVSIKLVRMYDNFMRSEEDRFKIKF
jgi:hypothetical protein